MVDIEEEKTEILTPREAEIIHSDIHLSADFQLPDLRINVPLILDHKQILRTFKVVADQFNFYVKEQSTNSVTVIYKRPLTCKEIITCCLVTRKRKKTQSTVKILVLLNDAKQTRIVFIKSIAGWSETILPLIQTYRKKLEAAILTVSVKHWSGAEGYQFVEPDEDDFVLTCKNESSSFYQIHKILTDDSTELGQKIAQFISTFISNIENINASIGDLTAPMTEIKQQIDSTVETLLTRYNFGRSNSDQIIQYCRPAVEKYLFSKIYNGFFALYELKCEQKQEDFAAKTKEIKESGAIKVMEVLQIKQNYIIDSLYRSTIDIFNRISQFFSPLEKINWWISAISNMKTEVVDHWNGRVTLESMDDEIPLLIYIIAFSDVKSLLAEIEFMQDYMVENPKFEKDLRLLTDIQAGVTFILENWPKGKE